MKNKTVLNRIKMLFFGIFVFYALNGQEVKTVYGSFLPADLGIGVRVDVQGEGNRYYGSLSYGNWGAYRAYWLRDHVKLTAGYMYPLKERSGYYKYWVNVGLNYHYVRSRFEYDHPCLDTRIYRPWSFELGMTAKVRKFMIGLRTDILRWEPCVDISTRLKF